MTIVYEAWYQITALVLSPLIIWFWFKVANGLAKILDYPRKVIQNSIDEHFESEGYNG